MDLLTELEEVGFESLYGSGDDECIISTYDGDFSCAVCILKIRNGFRLFKGCGNGVCDLKELERAKICGSGIRVQNDLKNTKNCIMHALAKFH